MTEIEIRKLKAKRYRLSVKYCALYARIQGMDESNPEREILIQEHQILNLKLQQLNAGLEILTRKLELELEL